MKTKDFANVIDFAPSRTGVVYVFFLVASGVETPFYVGQTDRFTGRMDDYGQASFKASTDFKVGEAVRYLTDTMKCHVKVGYNESANPRDEERGIIKRLQAEGIRLLNELDGYKYKSADEAAERKRVHDFCRNLVAALRSD